MKINSKRLRQIVKEEIQYLQEFLPPKGSDNEPKELPPCPDFKEQDFVEVGGFGGFGGGMGGGIADTLWDYYARTPDFYKLIGLEQNPQARRFLDNYNWGTDKDGKRFEGSKMFRYAVAILASSKLGDGWGSEHILYATPRDREWAIKVFACRGASVSEMEELFDAINFENMENTIREYHGRPDGEQRMKMQQHAIQHLPSPSGTRYMQ